MTVQHEGILKQVPKTKNHKCPECLIRHGDCDCNFNCPSCGTKGVYMSDHILCPNDECRVTRFLTQ